MRTKTINELEIWNGIINPDRHDMSAPKANAVLRWCFNDEARSAMEALAHRNGRGELSEAEREQRTSMSVKWSRSCKRRLDCR